MNTTPVRATRVAAALTAAAAGLAVITPTSSAVVAPSQGDDSPRPVARAAGVLQPGDAYMGWSQDSSSTVSPDLSSQRSGSVYGIDVSGHQGYVNWDAYWDAGKRFAYVKATEGTYYRNPYYAQQYGGSYARGFIRGAYHFARPDKTIARVQADYFIANGGGWSPDGKTLPGVLDIEYNPYGATCYGKTQQAMTRWVYWFARRYKRTTGRFPVIYTTTDWWRQCTGDATQYTTKSGRTLQFGNRLPLWLARYSSTPGTLPQAWDFYTFWQYSDKPIDQNVFNGGMTQLRTFASS